MNSKTFCIIPWTHTRIGTTGKITPCCKISDSFPSANINDISDFDHWWNSDQLKQLRQDLGQNVKSQYCQVCWIDEAAGKSSLRQEYNKRLGRHSDLKKIISSTDFYSDQLPMAFELDMGNVCNFKCVMCDPTYSSKVQAERVQHQTKFSQLNFIKPVHRHQYDWPNQEFFQSLFAKAAPNIKLLQLKGGEPLLIDNVMSVIKSIENKYQTLLYLTTNGSVFLDDEFIATLAEFQSCAVHVSVDGIGDQGEYIRYGSNWHTTKQTIDRLRVLPNCTFRINTVFQIFSAVTFPQIAEYALTNDLDMELLLCHSPDFLGINSMLPRHHDQLSKYVQQQCHAHPDVPWLGIAQGFLDTYEFDPILHSQCAEYITTLNSIRHNERLDIQDLFATKPCIDANGELDTR